MHNDSYLLLGSQESFEFGVLGFGRDGRVLGNMQTAHSVHVVLRIHLYSWWEPGSSTADDC